MSVAEANIQVVVRCRPRSEKEIKENSPSLVSFNNVRSKELNIRSILSDRNLSRSYTFDKVFSPDASQELIYRDVVAPILDEVLTGYNCTIFAYGQTGTGKTYTMEGNLQEHNGRFAPDAGMIPRALYSLFDILEAGGTEYTVKVSCVELYNEELQDLLSPGEDARKLRVYEDKKGVNIQGVEEVNVTSASDVLSLLQRANIKRRNAATQLNEHSSRSHGVYTMTVFTKETTPEGEELLKTGKLNLVDLAGSENIGRSGAEHKRAREAGMINQSLLTLGRVINALVEKSPHIPYRESKLTRLLQDSLGGRTKTCIIATISPARCNLEETQSTLDYAHRAKNIRNRPEVNQRMTKRALLSTYAVEIERLKTDLQAAREKNGIYLTQDRFNELSETVLSQKQLLDQYKADIEMYQQSLETEKNLHLQCRKQLTDTKVSLQSARASLEDQKVQLQQLFKRTKEDELVFQKMTQRETNLRHLTLSMIDSLKLASLDVHQLHDTLASARSLIHENQSTVESYQAELVTDLRELSDKLSLFDSVHTSVVKAIESKLDLLSSTYNNYLTSTSDGYHQFIQLIHDRFTELSDRLTQYEALPSLTSIHTHFANLQKDILTIMEGFVSHFQTWSTHVQDQLVQKTEDLQSNYRSFQTQLFQFLGTLKEHFQSQHTDLQTFVTAFLQFKSELGMHFTKTKVQAFERVQTQKEEHEKRVQQFIQAMTQLIQTHSSAYLNDFEAHVLESDKDTQQFNLKLSELTQSTINKAVELAKKEQGQLTQLNETSPTFHSLVQQSTSQLQTLQSNLLQLLKNQHETFQTEKSHALVQLEALVQHGQDQVDVILDQRSTLVSEIQTQLQSTEHYLRAEIQHLNEEALVTQESLLHSLEACHPKPLETQCKSLVETVNQHTSEIEHHVTLLTKKRLRDGDELCIPSKKRYTIPEPSDLPPPSHRELLLENVQEPEVHSPIPSPLLMPSKLPKLAFIDPSTTSQSSS